MRSYDASSGSSSQLPSQAGGLEAQFMKEFLDMAKENNMTIPERLQKLIPDGAKDAIREQQKKLNKYMLSTKSKPRRKQSRWTRRSGIHGSRR